MKVNHGYVRRLALTPEQAATLDEQGHAARALWNLLHDWTTGHGRCHRPTLKQADDAIRQAKRLNRRWAQLWVPKVGTVRFRRTGPIPGVGREPGKLTGARLVREVNGWHVAFRAEVSKPTPAQHSGPAIGIDQGVNVALALSDGNDQTHGPWMRPKEAERLLRLERRAA